MLQWKSGNEGIARWMDRLKAGKGRWGLLIRCVCNGGGGWDGAEKLGMTVHGIKEGRWQCISW